MERKRQGIDIDTHGVKKRREEEKQHLLAKVKGVEKESCHHLEHLAEVWKRTGGTARWDSARSTEEERKTTASGARRWDGNNYSVAGGQAAGTARTTLIAGRFGRRPAGPLTLH